MSYINLLLDDEENMAPKIKTSLLPTRCMRCLHEIKATEPYYNVKNEILCEICFSLPPENGG